MSAGYYSGGTVLGDPDLIAANILNTANIFGVQGSVIAGKPQATGDYTVSSGTKVFTRGINGEPTTSSYFIEINGLNFPDGIQFIAAINYNGSMFFVNPSTYPVGFASYSGGNAHIMGWNTGAFKHNISPAYVSTTGFCIPVPVSEGSVVKWIVWGN
ncbi:hypothetical protein D3C73_703270 [compost metagenome]